MEFQYRAAASPPLLLPRPRRRFPATPPPPSALPLHPARRNTPSPPLHPARRNTPPPPLHPAMEFRYRTGEERSRSPPPSTGTASVISGSAVVRVQDGHGGGHRSAQSGQPLVRSELQTVGQHTRSSWQLPKPLHKKIHRCHGGLPTLQSRPIHLEHGEVDHLHPLLYKVHDQGKAAHHRPHLKKLHLLDIVGIVVHYGELERIGRYPSAVTYREVTFMDFWGNLIVVGIWGGHLIQNSYYWSTTEGNKSIVLATMLCKDIKYGNLETSKYTTLAFNPDHPAARALEDIRQKIMRGLIDIKFVQDFIERRWAFLATVKSTSAARCQ